MATDDTGPGPLEGLRVLDLSRVVTGGFTTVQLADFGADVIKVEHPEQPDPVREFAPFADDVSLWWKSLGRNKRCVTLDLSTAEGAALALELAEDADLLVENFRPGTLERWGLGPEALHAANPGLVVVRLSLYGQTGPRAEQSGFGTVAEAVSGWASVNGFPDREPLLPPISLAGMTAAQYAVQAAMFALYERDVGASGQGQVVDVSLYEPLYRLFVGHVEAYARDGRVPERTGNRHPSAAPRGVYETADGHIALTASSQGAFERLAAAIDRPDLPDDPRFRTNADRVANVEAVDAIVEAWTAERTTDEALAVLLEHDAAAGPINDVADTFADEQFRARENVVGIDDDEIGRFRTVAPVPKLGRTPASLRHAGPRHGAHNEAVYLEELGLPRDRYEALVAAGVV